MRKVSFAIGALQERYGDAEAIRLAKQIGADGIDFCLTAQFHKEPDSVYAKGDAEVVRYYTELRHLADALGIEICQTHGRLRGFRNDPEWDEAVIEDARLDLMASDILGAPVCVIHSVTTGALGPDTDPALMHELNKEMFCRILPYAAQYGVTLASETFGDSPRHACCDFFGNAVEFEKSFQDVRAESPYGQWLAVCVDTGHSNKAMRFGNPKPGDVIRRMGPHVRALHLNDNDTLTDQHKLPMTGSIDWNDVFDALDEIGYEGVYNMELNLRHFGEDFAVELAAFAVKLMRHLLEQRYGKEAKS